MPPFTYLYPHKWTSQHWEVLCSMNKKTELLVLRCSHDALCCLQTQVLQLPYLHGSQLVLRLNQVLPQLVQFILFLWVKGPAEKKLCITNLVAYCKIKAIWSHLWCPVLWRICFQPAINISSSAYIGILLLFFHLTWALLQSASIPPFILPFTTFTTPIHTGLTQPGRQDW